MRYRGRARADLVDSLQHNLEMCEHERLELEVKYGLEYADFRHKLEAGGLGNEFGYDLEMDAMRWDDLVTEKRYWLRQLIPGGAKCR